MVDKINQATSIPKSRSVKRSKESNQTQKQNGSSDEELLDSPLLEGGVNPSKKLQLLVEEQGVDVARRQLIREILLEKFGSELTSSAEFEHSLEKLNQRIESIPELKNEYDNYLLKLKT
ncbi:hypothetical protein [Kangiella sp. HZ709]|uniref:hypothetical protein n=1 Tax=Kangiella sp. HZ709 TaxID=2666328 RepID=UPI0012B0CC49|nr:hypothetical protein [Kangiella sp. HZ709]MRX26838.1 hypothetical protein [Kangiella sp. HZ709]